METTNQKRVMFRRHLKRYLAENFQSEVPFASAFFESKEPRFLRSAVPIKKMEEAKPFSQFLYHWIDVKHLDDVELYKKAQIDRRLFSKMKSPEYTPEKTTVFKLILAMELNLREAKEFLESAGFSFSRSSKGDLIVKYCIENDVFDLFQVNEWLLENGEHIL